ncbi:MAG: nitrous oxide-stimulated promoter family protein [Planctomycetes bacterium]|nr:nitrous oxide-stimulated promoter family protein [Planctomycetota bacterium]
MCVKHARIDREKRTIQAMVRIYCRAHHRSAKGTCEDCGLLLDYAMGRLDRCPFGNGKGTCADCTIHCYKPDLRDKVRSVMRFAGPRMIFRHPILAILHLLDGRKQPSSFDKENP